MCVTAIANLLQICQKDNDHRTFFHKDKDIIPFIECHWESMTTMPRRVTQSWHATVSLFFFFFIKYNILNILEKFRDNFRHYFKKFTLKIEKNNYFTTVDNKMYYIVSRFIKLCLRM